MDSAKQPGTLGISWRERPWYPFVVATYPLWFLYVANLGQVSASAAIVASALALAVVAILLWVAARVMGSRAVGAMAVTVIIAGFYAYGPVHDIYVRAQTVDEMAPAARWLSTTLANHTKLTAVMLGLCALVIALIVKRRANVSPRVTGACNITVGGRVELSSGSAKEQPYGWSSNGSCAPTRCARPCRTSRA